MILDALIGGLLIDTVMMLHGFHWWEALMVVVGLYLITAAPYANKINQ